PAAHRLQRCLASIAGFAALVLALGCGDANPDLLGPAKAELAAGHWDAALASCSITAARPAASAALVCEARCCARIAPAVQFVGELNDFLLPNFRTAELGVPRGTLDRYVAILQLMDRISATADEVVGGGCSFDLLRMPFRLGDAPDPIVSAEIRGRWTTRSALVLQAII